MRLRRALAAAGVALAVFAGALAFTFPTDALVRALLVRVPPPGGATVEFARAVLRPWGLRLEDVLLRRADGHEIAALEAVTLRPSLAGLLRDQSGRPWHLAAVACGGRVDAVLDTDGDGQRLVLDWRDVDLARCPPLAVTGDAAAGTVDGSARLALDPTAGLIGVGTLRIRNAAWQTGGRLPGVAALHADPAVVEWSLAQGRLLLDRIDLHGPELSATGQGSVTLARALGRSALDVALAVTPGPGAPPFVRDVLGGLPAADGVPGARRLGLGGTLAAPRLVW